MKRKLSRVVLTRRGLLKAGVVAGASGLLALRMAEGRKGRDRGSRDPDGPRFTPFQATLPIPPVLEPVDSLPTPVGHAFHGVAPEFDPARFSGNVSPEHRAEFEQAADIIAAQTAFPLKLYQQYIEESVAEIVPGLPTDIFGYSGISPGPTIMAKYGEPIVVRYFNALNVETSVHAHGGHWPAHADGYPDHYVLPGLDRDYYYPNIVPLYDGQPDFSDALSTLWYHDHAMDITGHNVNRGLIGFYLCTDEFERALIELGVLPGGDGFYDNGLSGYGQTDIPLVFADKRLDRKGALLYDFLDHDGHLGNIMTVNGKVQPVLHVERRKYRFRILAGGNSRVWAFRLSRGTFITIGNDSSLLPVAIGERIITLAPAQRADVVVDFTRYQRGEEVFLENVMEQVEGRGPEGINTRKPTPLLKFIVGGAAVTSGENASVEPGTLLRPHRSIREEEIVTTRYFEFERQNGAWKINQLFFNPERADAVPILGSAERWIFENKSGGWWHPIHLHLESHQVERVDGEVTRPRIGVNSDTTSLGGNGRAVVTVRFRTFPGPFVFHCHNVEHEDMRMMSSFDPKTAGTFRPLDKAGNPKRPEEVTGVPDGLLDAIELFEDQVADHDRLGDPPRDSEVIGEITTR